MMARSLIVALAALAASAPVNAFGGSTAPERVTHRYDLQCGGKNGALVLEERFDRATPALSVAITGYTALGASASSPATGDELDRASAQMARIDRVTWLCDQKKVTVRIDYLDRATYDQAVKADKPIGDEQSRMRRTYLVLDSGGLTVESSGAPSAPVSRGR